MKITKNSRKFYDLLNMNKIENTIENRSKYTKTTSRRAFYRFLLY